MIVVDTNVIAYLFLPGTHTAAARRAYERDPAWVAPLWRSEFRNILATSLRRGHLQVADAIELMDLACNLMDGGEYEADSANVLRLAAESRCSAYDCEFVALGQELQVPLVTPDRKIRLSFEATTIGLADFASEDG